MKIHEITEAAGNDLIAKAIEIFGITTDFREAGYLFPDGRMLDMSGRSQTDYFVRQDDRFVLKPGQRFDDFRGQRYLDHRDITNVFPDVETQGTEGMHEFMRLTGAIRNLPGTGISVVQPPDFRHKGVVRAVSGHRSWYDTEEFNVDMLVGNETLSVTFPPRRIPAAFNLKLGIELVYGVRVPDLRLVPKAFIRLTQQNESAMMPAATGRRPMLHFVGFVHPHQGKDPRYDAAVRAFGPPDFIHRRWDERARQEIAPGDKAVFAKGDGTEPPSIHTFDDSNVDVQEFERTRA